MEQHSDYVSQLKLEFDSCDSTSSGFLDRDALTELCRKLRLDTHLPLLTHTLLGERRHARVNFEEFKEGFVAVLSRSLDFSASEDDSSYLQPVVPEEAKPKLVKGSKRYGRRSHPDSSSSAERRDEEAQGSGAEQEEGRRAKLRRSTSLDSMESLKSDEETGSQKENVLADFPSKGVQQEEAEPAGGGGGVTQEVDELLDVRDFQKVMRGSAPFSCSTPLQSADLQRTPYRGSAALEECSVRSASPSLLTAAGGGQRVLTRLDEGSGCTGPERVLNLWREEGIRNSRDILQTLDFSLEERLSLVDLTLALDNELLVSGNGIHQAALVSYKNEIQHLQVQVEQACRQRDKMKADLEQAEQRNLQLVGEVDERHACMETLNHSRIRELQQDFRERVQCVRSEAEQENEALLEKGERERASLQEELRLLREKELQLEEELSSTSQESRRLEEDLRAVQMKLSEAEGSVSKLQRDLDQLLLLKFGSLDPAAAGLSHEERFSQIVKDCELQLRELRDRNDELNSEVELLKNQRSEKKSRRSAGDAPNWTQQHNSDESDMKRGASPPARKKLQPSDKTALCSLEEVSGPALSIQTELAVEQLKMKHNEDLQQLHIQLETQVNYYERSLEVMRQSMEVERKDISQAFKMEISEVEEQKSQVEQQVKELKEALEKRGRGGGGGGGWSHEQERKMQRERADLEQNFAREIGNLVKSLRDEKDELEAELQLKMDRETMLLRTQLEEARSENVSLQERLSVRQQEVQSLEEEVSKRRRKLEEMESDHERSREEEERLHKENSGYREEVLLLSSRNLQLSNENAELSSLLHGDQESVRMLRERLATVAKEQEDGGATVRRLQDAAQQQQRETMQLQAERKQERKLQETELNNCKEKLERLSGLQSELSSLTLKLQWMEEDKHKLLKEAEERNQKVEGLEAELLQDQLLSVSQERHEHAQEVTSLNRKLQDAQSTLEDLKKEREGPSSLQEENLKLRVQNQELQHKLAELQVRGLELHKLTLEQQNLKSRVRELQGEQKQNQDQAVREALRLHSQQSSSQISMKQVQYEKAVLSLQQRTDQLETKLKAVRLVLQEKVSELREQLSKSSQLSAALQDLYVENAQLMKALQVTEQRQKHAEKKNFQLEDKVSALTKLLRDIVPAALAT